MKKLLAVAITLAGFSHLLLCQDKNSGPEAEESDLPRIPATEPVDALKTFKVLEGYQLELVAHEPLVVDPIAITFDEEGAMFAIEMRGYSERRDDRLGRIKKLVDTNGDGFYDQSTIYAEGLKWPTAVVCYKGGIFVGATPDLFYFKDNDGDGVSDEKRVVFSGFGPPADQMRVNMQALFNSLCWGPDNRIWGASSRNGGMVNGVNLRGADFSFDPEKLDIRPENGVGQNGMDFDDEGHRYVCSNSNHIVRVMWERGWTGSNPFYSLPSPLVSIADDGEAAPVFRISPDEPWRIVRTRWRVSGVVKGIVEGGGRVSGYFTSATGITIYKGDAMPECRGMAFIGDVGSNLVHRKKITYRDGHLQPVATRVDENVEIIASSDNWFRPANFANAPDGSLYVVDMYRETIEHPWSIPEGIKKHLDLNSGNDRGRIYRLSRVDGKRSPVENLSGKSDEELVALVKTGGFSWNVSTARRLLFERGKPVNFEMKASPFLNALAQAKYDAVAPETIGELAGKSGSDPWMIAALTNGINSLSEAEAGYENGSESLRIEIAKLMGKASWSGGSEIFVKNDAPIAVWAAFSSGGKTKAEIIENGGDILTRAQQVVTSSKTPTAERVAAVHLLSNVGKLESRLLNEILRERESGIGFRVTIFDAFAKSDPVTLSKRLIDSWSELPVELKSRAIPFLVYPKKDRAMMLLNAVQSGIVSKSEIPPDQAAKLRKHGSKTVSALANELIPEPELLKRSEVVAKYQGALRLKGDVENGKRVYQKVCMTCHQSPDGRGFSLGPNLVTFKSAGADSLLKNIFDPNAEIAPQFQAFQFSLKNGEQHTGIIASENQIEVTIRSSGGKARTFLRSDVRSMKGLGISLMPEGLEAALTVEDVADLLAFIENG